MCTSKDEAVTKIDRLIDTMERLIQALLATNANQRGNADQLGSYPPIIGRT